MNRYNLKAIEETLQKEKLLATDPSDISFLVSHFHGLSDDARKFIAWACLFGSTCVFISIFYHLS